ncbi:MAG: hypothetical protein WCA82_01685 [Jiangellales bacterium]
MIRTRIAWTIVTTTALLGVTGTAGAATEPLPEAEHVDCAAEPPMVLTLGHLHRWQMGLDDAIPGPC